MQPASRERELPEKKPQKSVSACLPGLKSGARRSAQQDRLVVCPKTIGPSLNPGRHQLPETPSFGRFGWGNTFGQRAAIRAHGSVEHGFVHSGTEQLGSGEIGLAEIGPGQIGPT